MGDSLKDLRDRLDAIDQQIVEALAGRQALIAQVAQVKATPEVPLRDVEREEALLARVSALGRAAGLEGHFVTQVYKEILDYSLRTQQEAMVDRQNPDRGKPAVTVAYQGTDGAYSHLAAMKHFAPRSVEATFKGFDTFSQMLEAVEVGGADYAMLPIENTTAGSINEAYDLLASMGLSLVGEEIQPVDHCLVALGPVPISEIRRVYSHPQALAQCGDFLGRLERCHVEAFTDTAMAVKKVRDDKDMTQAAVASAEAARLYGLHIIKQGIANQRENYTRFVVAAARPVAVDLRMAAKTSLILATRHEDGALVRCLNALAERHLNLTKLESRPRPNTPWEYLFYVDFEGNLADPAVREAIQALSAHTSFLKVLGTYPARNTRDARPVEPRRARIQVGATPSGGSPPGASPSGASPSGAAPSGAAPSASAGASGSSPSGAGASAPEALDESVLQMLQKKPYKLASRAHRREDSRIVVGSVVIGGPDPVVIAGPCSVETPEQMMSAARAVKELGADILRGGCFKPRTSPYSFQGLGFEGLDLLYDAGKAVGLPIVTEVLDPGDVERVALKADILQIGARNMQNFALLKEVGQVDRPVMLKRGLMADIDEWLAAAEYILSHGNQQVFLCERGIRTFETATRNTLDLSAVPVVQERSHLPVIVDPSHACGTWRWIAPMARAAIAVGAHGIMVEVHPNPSEALSDGPQALKFDRFGALMRSLRP